MNWHRTRAGLAVARARARQGGPPFTMTPGKLRLVQTALQNHATQVMELCKEVGISRQTLYRHLSPDGQIRDAGHRLLAKGRQHTDR